MPARLHLLKTTVIEPILLALGIFLFFTPHVLFIKIGLTCLLFGLLIPLIANTNILSLMNHLYRKIHLRHHTTITWSMSEKMVTIVVLWILSMFFLTLPADPETFFIIIFIGFLILSELTQEFTTAFFKKRMNTVLSIFFIIFLVIVLQKITEIINV